MFLLVVDLNQKQEIRPSPVKRKRKEKEEKEEVDEDDVAAITKKMKITPGQTKRKRDAGPPNSKFFLFQNRWSEHESTRNSRCTPAFFDLWLFLKFLTFCRTEVLIRRKGVER